MKHLTMWLAIILPYVCSTQAKPNEYQVAVERTVGAPTKENIIELGGHLRGIGRYNAVPQSNEQYLLIQKTLLAIPGHAQYLADLLEEERAKFKAGDFQVNYDQERYWILRDTLRHLPSPETVMVLGHYLADERDDPALYGVPDDGGTPPPNSIIAMESLLLIGLRDAPYPPGRYYSYLSTKELAAFREWFGPIQSGEKQFSFKGQAVEYRFKPDGTWVVTPIANAPDDAPKPLAHKPPLTSTPEKRLAMATTQGQQPALWTWSGGVLLVAIGILIWQIMARCARKSP